MSDAEKTVINGRLVVDLAARESYLLVKGTGEADLQDFHKGIDHAAEAARREGHKRVLFDLLGTRQSLAFSDHLLLGQHLARAFHFAERVASVVPRESRTGASEKAAQKTGLKIRAFVDADEAVAWLREP